MGKKLRQALKELREKLRRIGRDHSQLYGLRKKTGQVIKSVERRFLIDPFREAGKIFEVRCPERTALINSILTPLRELGI